MKATILFVDDQRRIRQYCKMELESAGYHVVLAEDGIDALDVLDSISVDLVILDEHMARCSGLEAAQKIRQWYPNVPIILFTLDPDYEDYSNPLVDDTVVKSDNLNALKESMARLLLKSQPTVRTKRHQPIAK